MRALRLRSPRLLLAIAPAIFLLVVGCTNDDAVLGVGVFTIPPGAQISLSKDIQPIFNVNCATGGCHDSITQAQFMSLEAPDIFDPVIGIVDVASTQGSPLDRVEPGDSSMSYLVHKLEGTQALVGGGGEQMPKFLPPLTQPEIQLIRDWIDEGAQDN